MFFIESERLKIIPLTHKLLQLLNTDRAAMECALSLNMSHYQVSGFYQKEIADAMVNFWLPKTLEHPKAFKWCTNWEIVLKTINTSIGEMGFNGEPDEHGETEIGYMINEEHQNQGYASETLKLLSGWAFTQSGVKAVVVHNYANNLPSRRILAKCEFKEVSKDEEGLMTFRLENDDKKSET